MEVNQLKIKMYLFKETNSTGKSYIIKIHTNMLVIFILLVCIYFYFNYSYFKNPFTFKKLKIPSTNSSAKGSPGLVYVSTFAALSFGASFNT